MKTDFTKEKTHMKNDKPCCVFAQYIKQNTTVLLFFAAAAGLFALVFSLYELPAEAVIYAFVLSLLLAAIIIPDQPPTATEYLKLSKFQRPEGAIRVLRAGLACLSLP